MNKVVCLFLLIFYSGLCNCQSASRYNTVSVPSTFSDSQLQHLYEKLKPFPEHTQLSIAAVNNNKIYHYGVIVGKDTITQIENSESIFEIGSITKVFTAVLLADFITESKIGPTDKLQDYFDFDLKEAGKITLTQLASHTSGLPRLPSNFDFSSANSHDPYKNYTATMLNSYLKNHLTLDHQPGTQYAYSNLGTGLLGYILTLNTQTPFEDLLRHRIFDKYGMHRSSTNTPTNNASVVKGLNPEGGITSSWNFDVLAGAGAVRSCTADLAQFMVANFDSANTVLSRTHKPLFKVNDQLEIGSGWHIIRLNDKRKVLGHSGGTGGFTSSMAVDISRSEGVVILSNVSTFHSNANLINELCFELLETIHQ